jgi:hypothetical protein
VADHDINAQDIARLLAAAEAVVAAEDERADREEWAEVRALADEAAATTDAVLRRTAEMRTLRGGKPIGGQSREMLHWLEDSIARVAAVFGQGCR